MSKDDTTRMMLDALGTDLNEPVKLANMFRVRGDRMTAVLDFGYALPLLPDEMAVLEHEQVNVHTRVAMPYELVLQLIETLQSTVDAARKAGAMIPGSEPGPV
ncbi:MAG: hypothetical protein CVV27_09185 [Candidatus Melainabacteria bacterium HGW-Melainabacteria-1]|nr:MAG: hypothetical protein CVV27_09185 [Candidatus Melainabacteria bacterium HGW-Melainabacteria-1]